MDPQRRKIIVVVLIVVTVALGALAVLISYYSQQTQAPDDSSADIALCSTLSSNCVSFTGGAGPSGSVICITSSIVGSPTNYCCPVGQSIQNGSCAAPAIDYSSTCSPESVWGPCAMGALGTSCSQVSGGRCYSNGTNDGNGSPRCACTPPSTGGGGGNPTPLSDCTTTCTDGDGCTCPTSPVCTAGAGATVANGANCGETVSTGGGGSSSGGGTSSGGGSNGGGTAQCGNSCNSNADCAAAATQGVTVVCRNGICENSACATGKTIPGANCACSSLNACGQPCSAALGLCQTGSSCGFIGSPSACLQNEGQNNGTQYCLPNAPAKGYTLAACSGIAASNLRSPLGTDVTLQAQILEACGLTTTPTTPTNPTTPVCGDGVCANTESSFTCAVDCRLPDTAIFSDRIDRIILGVVIIILGISLAGGFDRLRRNTR